MSDVKQIPIGIMSRAIANIPNIEKLLGLPIKKSFLGRFWKPIQSIAGWGHKPSADKARKYAQKHKLPYIAIEDGFLRSVKLGKFDPPQSIVIDDIGIYYDARQPSRLEHLIKQPLDQEQIKRTQDLINLWKEARVSKYNHLREIDPQLLPEKYVLLADQTKDDSSIEGGLADETSFNRMLDAALNEYSDCKVLIKVHPEVKAGIKEGYFDFNSIKTNQKIQILDQDVHPVTLIEHAQAIFTVTSQIGFEGLLWGKPVFTFGMPFYAGWGLTGDELQISDRRHPINLTQLVHAALIEYPSYLHPETNERCQVEDLIDWIAFQRKMREKFPPKLYALNFSWNKKQSIKKFFTNSEIKYIKHEDQAVPKSQMLVWGSTSTARKDLEIIRLEDGFIRSVGLGADLIRPTSWVADKTGIYYDSSKSSDLEQLLLTFDPDERLLTRAQKLKEAIVGSGLTKYNLSGSTWTRPKGLNADQRVILVAGQIESDASIAKGAVLFKTNYELLSQVRKENPDAYIVYKPHPDVVAKLRKKGLYEERATDLCDEVIEDASINDLMLQVDEVHVLTSLTGFEALIRNRRVVIYGQPFYSGWGLTIDMTNNPRRNRTLSLNQLIAGVLIEYPMYVTKSIRGWITPEAAIELMIKKQDKKIYFKKQRAVIRRHLVRWTSSRV